MPGAPQGNSLKGATKQVLRSAVIFLHLLCACFALTCVPLHGQDRVMQAGKIV